MYIYHTILYHAIPPCHTMQYIYIHIYIYIQVARVPRIIHNVLRTYMYFCIYVYIYTGYIYCLLHIVCCLLPIAYWPLPIVHCLLSMQREEDAESRRSCRDGC